MDQLSQIEDIMDAHRQRAILALRPYPPIDMPKTQSDLGGSPQLPAGIEWPRASDGTALHFLAAIDCAELPKTNAPLPASGLLLFFARIDEEMVWDERNPHGIPRVLYVEAGPEKPADPPAGFGAHS